MQLAAARAETRSLGYAQERVCEATLLSEEGAEVEVWYHVRCAMGASVGERGGGILGGWHPLGLGI